MHLPRQLYDDFHVRTEENQRTKKLKEIYEKVDGYAYGKQVQRLVDPLEKLRVAYESRVLLEGYYITEKIPGKLKPPLPVLLRDIREIRQPLEELMAVAREVHKDIVVIFDGLDRLLDPTKFWSVVYQDLRLFRELKVSILATARFQCYSGLGSVNLYPTTSKGFTTLQ